jgi:hypothetical protein
MYEPIGPCIYDEHGDYIQLVQLYRCRFWHCTAISGESGHAYVVCDSEFAGVQ